MVAAASTTLDAVDQKVQAKVDFSLLFQMGILGFVALAPWNFVLTELFYLDSKFHHGIGSNVAIIYSIAVNLAQLLLIWTGNKFTFAPRFDWGCGVLAVFNVLLAVVAMTIGNGNANDNELLGYCLALGCVFLLGFGHAIMESSAFGLAALCPPNCMVWVMVGEGIAGAVGWPLNMFIDWALRAGGVERVNEWRCLLFFCFTSLITLAVVPMYRMFTAKHPYMKEVLSFEAQRSTASLSTRQTSRPVSAIIKDILPMAICAWTVLTITFTVFPVQVISWTAQAGPEHNDAFIPQITYTFQLADIVGRFLPNVGVNMGETVLIIFSLCRLGFIPLFVATSLYPYTVPFHWDWFKHAEMVVFAITNGVACTLAMMHGPQRVPNDKKEQEVAGYSMGFCLINGILIGGLFGILVQIICGQEVA